MDCKIISRTVARMAVSAGVLGALVVVTGCQNYKEPNSFLDPTALGTFSHQPLVVPILNNLNIGAEEDQSAFPGARDVIADDLVVTPTDYRISANDAISVQVSDLMGPNTLSESTKRVTQTGKISLQLIPEPIKVEGMTEQQVEVAIHDAYRDAKVANDPQVSVAVVEPRGRTFTINGAVGSPGTYTIFDKEFRLIDALTIAREPQSAEGLDYVYIVRKKDTATTGDTTTPAGTTPTVDPLAPRSSAESKIHRSVMLAQDANNPQGGIVVIDGKEVPVQPTVAATEPSAVTVEPTTTPAGEAFEFNALKEPEDRYTIRVPYQPLRAGQLKYNVVIKPGDLVIVPNVSTGTYYMGGYVGSPGAYSIPPSRITLAQAIVSARGFNDNAIPARTEIIRQLPGDKQVFVRVNLEKIYAGQEPDIYLKPNDRVNVGTNIIAPFLSAIRNGFRMSYGFGFLYDRNFGPDDNNNNN